MEPEELLLLLEPLFLLLDPLFLLLDPLFLLLEPLLLLELLLLLVGADRNGNLGFGNGIGMIGIGEHVLLDKRWGFGGSR